MADLRGPIDKLLGATGNFILHQSRRPGFFTPYQSASDFGYRTASLIAAPVMLAGFSLQVLLQAGYEFLKAIGYCLTGNFTPASKCLGIGAASLFVVTPILLIAALLSPLINLVDLTVSAFTSIKHSLDTPIQEENPGFQP